MHLGEARSLAPPKRPMSNDSSPIQTILHRPARPDTSAWQRREARRSARGESPAWPLQVFTFGRFSLIADGAPLVFCGKTPKRPVTLLKVILAFGGRDVSEHRLTQVLWPDDDGDAAHDALGVNLHRLRKLLGNHDAVILHDGRVSLDPCRCWVDAWAFQRLLGSAAQASTPERSRMLESALALYRGPFLACEQEEPWSLAMRERLRSMFVRHSAELGRLHEEAGRWDKAIACYQRCLETDELGEEFYQGLMRCYGHLGRRAEGVSVYRRLRHTLSVVLGIAVSPASEELLHLLLML